MSPRDAWHETRAIVTEVDIGRLLDALRSAEPGIRAQAFDTPSVNGGQSDSTPVERDALRTPDRAETARRNLEKDITALHRTAERIHRQWTHWVTQVEAAQDRADRLAPGCWIMAQVAHWEAVHVESDLARWIDPPLTTPRPIGLWAYTFVRKHQRLPNKGERAQRAKGQRVAPKRQPNITRRQETRG